MGTYQKNARKDSSEATMFYTIHRKEFFPTGQRVKPERILREKNAKIRTPHAVRTYAVRRDRDNDFPLRFPARQWRVPVGRRDARTSFPGITGNYWSRNGELVSNANGGLPRGQKWSYRKCLGNKRQTLSEFVIYFPLIQLWSFSPRYLIIDCFKLTRSLWTISKNI